MKQSLSSHALLALVCGVSLLGAGCGGASDSAIATDTGNPYDEEDTGEAVLDGCDAVDTELELGASTPLGFSAQAIAELVDGDRERSLEWLEVPGLPYGPESGRSGITLRVEPLGTARLVDRSPATPGTGGAIALAGALDGCRDSLELDVRIELETTGGALVESLETRVEAYAADFASASFSVELEDLAGSFDAQPAAPPNMQITRVQLVGQLGFSEYGAVGSLSVQSESQSTDGAVGQSARQELAHFPADDYCGAPNGVSVLAEQAVRGLSLQAALDGLNAQSPAAVQFSPAGSSQLELTFAATPERVCIVFDRDPLFVGEAGGAILRVPGSVRVLSDDGRLDGEFPVELSAQTLDGGLRFSAEAGEQSQDLARAAQLPALFGVADAITFDGYRGGSVRFQSYATANAASGGSLVVSGLDVPECLSNPPPVDPEAMGAPGCRGIDAVPLWSARWGTPE